MVEHYALTDPGRKRTLNEDSYLADPETNLFIVADGMGGHSAGEVASKLAVDVISNFITRSYLEDEITWPFGVDARLSFHGNRLLTSIKLANKRVFRAAEKKEEYTGMGTTVVAAILHERRLTLCSVGDSRAYLVSEGKLQRLTRDDSWVGEALAGGIISPAEAQGHPLRNIITKAVGAKEHLEFDVKEMDLSAGSILLLCTDGLHAMLKDEQEILSIISSRNDLESMARALVDAANARGGEDNVTVLLIRVA
ncbi:MAG: Stp1/IreP family PP2C-type Ser/Thr phosphatase [Acidobacteriota bacterium]